MGGLLLIGTDQILAENFLGQGRADLLHALFGEETLAGFGGVGNQVNMRVVPLVVEGGVPFEMGGRDLQPFRQDDGLGAKQISPAGGGVEAQPLGVLPAQGVDGCPDIPPVSVHLLGHFVK